MNYNPQAAQLQEKLVNRYCKSKADTKVLSIGIFVTLAHESGNTISAYKAFCVANGLPIDSQFLTEISK